MSGASYSTSLLLNYTAIGGMLLLSSNYNLAINNTLRRYLGSLGGILACVSTSSLLLRLCRKDSQLLCFRSNQSVVVRVCIVVCIYIVIISRMIQRVYGQRNIVSWSWVRSILASQLTKKILSAGASG
jgi:hypothetical protein